MKSIAHRILHSALAAVLSVASASAHSWTSPSHALDLGIASPLDVGAADTPVPAASGRVDGYVSEIVGNSFFRSLGATVVLTNVATRARYFAITRANGYFEMSVPMGSYTTYAYKGARSGSSWGGRIALPFAMSARVNFNIR